MMKCQYVVTNHKQFSEKNDDQFLNSLYRGCLAKRLFLPSFTDANTSVAFHNLDVSDNIAQLNPSLWNMCLNEFDSFAHTMIMNDFLQ